MRPSLRGVVVWLPQNDIQVQLTVYSKHLSGRQLGPSYVCALTDAPWDIDMASGASKSNVGKTLALSCCMLPLSRPLGRAGLIEQTPVRPAGLDC